PHAGRGRGHLDPAGVVVGRRGDERPVLRPPQAEAILGRELRRGDRTTPVGRERRAHGDRGSHPGRRLSVACRSGAFPIRGPRRATVWSPSAATSTPTPCGSPTARGTSPAPAPGLPLLWFSPPERGVLDFPDLHPPRSLRRVMQRSALRLSVDAD